MYYLYPINKLEICFQSESHKNITKSKQSRKFFVSPVKFTKVHVRGFVNEPTISFTFVLINPSTLMSRSIKAHVHKVLRDSYWKYVSIANSRSCTKTELSKLLTSCLTAVKTCYQVL